jgi:hypothetical protein
VRGRVLVYDLAAALPDHAQRGAAPGRPTADDAQRQAVDRPDPSGQSFHQPLDGHSAPRGSPLWTTGTSNPPGGSILDADQGSMFNAD